MDIKNILNFLSAVEQHNNRPWFAEHKDWYDCCKADFDTFSENLIEQLALMDKELQGLRVKDCVYRIYRDIRFSPDKSPYKHHFGVYVAAGGGRRSPRGGYYFHLQPGNTLVSAGVWCPNSALLKALRQSIYDNVDELKEIMDNQSFKRYFSDMDTEDMLKTVPSGFPKDFEHADWLKRKSFTVTHMLTEKKLLQPNLMEQILDICREAKPYNRFLNYTVDELLL